MIQPGNRCRKWAIVGVAGCAAVLADLAFAVRHFQGRLGIDSRGDQLAGAHPLGLPLVPLSLAQRYVRLGTGPDFAVAVAVLVAAALLLGDRIAALIALVGPPAALALTEWVLKPLVGRREGLDRGVILQRATGPLGFPSGHTTAVAALATAAAVVAYRRWGLRGLVGAAPFVAVFPLAMVGTVVRLHIHVLSDALGGLAVGYGTVLAALAVVARPSSTSEPGPTLDQG
jgi:membrane-associated phospholipid phosphatase